jgi:hypothetical protein
MSTATYTQIITRAHTATHLSNAISGAIIEILTHLGISARSLSSDWASEYDPAIRAWIEEGSLAQVVLQCHRPHGVVRPIFEFPIVYSNDGSAGLSHRHVAAARQWVKLNSVPSGTSFKIICAYNGAHSDQPGWSATNRASTAGLRSVNFGTLAAGPHASASIRAYTD